MNELVPNSNTKDNVFLRTGSYLAYIDANDHTIAISKNPAFTSYSLWVICTQASDHLIVLQILREKRLMKGKP